MDSADEILGNDYFLSAFFSITSSYNLHWTQTMRVQGVTLLALGVWLLTRPCDGMGILQPEYWPTNLDPHKATLLLRALEQDRFVDPRWLELVRTCAPFDESHVAQALWLRYMNQHINVRDNANSGKTACRLAGTRPKDKPTGALSRSFLHDISLRVNDS
jgi:hypothetical protein